MPPVEYADKKNTRRIRFTTGVYHDGVDYGPECEQQEAEVTAAAAIAYVNQGRAVYVEDAVKSTEPPPESPKAKGGK